MASVSFCFVFVFCFYFLPLSLGGPFLHPVSVVSPLNVAQFASDLVGHPDRRAVSFVLQGPQHRFCLGFKPACRLKAANRNKPSAFQNPQVIDDYLALEVSHCRVVGPLSHYPHPELTSQQFRGYTQKRPTW